jgi:hypothetical protein
MEVLHSDAGGIASIKKTIEPLRWALFPRSIAKTQM